MKRPPVTLDVRRSEAPEGTAVYVLEGDVVLTNSDALEEAVEAAIDEGRPRVVLDAGAVAHVDMPGFARLVRLDERCQEAGGELVVAGLSRSFEQVVERLFLRRWLRFEDSVDAAIASSGR